MEVIPAIRSLTTLTQITTLEFGFDFCPSLVNERGQPARIAVLCFRGLTRLRARVDCLRYTKARRPRCVFPILQFISLGSRLLRRQHFFVEHFANQPCCQLRQALDALVACFWQNLG